MPLHIPIITLTTDFGYRGPLAGIMKGVILGINPEARIIDLTHEIGQYNVREAALTIGMSYMQFPKQTIHVVITDPGVGSRRKPVLVRTENHYFVGPDNGVFSMVYSGHEQCRVIHLTVEHYFLSSRSTTFDGRDVFAPVAAHLANGVPLSAVGASINDPLRLAIPRPQQTPHGWQGEVIHIDHFGSLSSNIRLEHLGHPAQVKVRVRGRTIDGMVQTFGERPPGTLVALYGSTGNLIVSVVNGSAAELLKAKIGDRVEVFVAE